VAAAPCGAAFDVGGQVVAGELVGAPRCRGQELGGVGAGVGPSVSAVVQVDAGQGVDVGLEGVEGFPLGGGEVVEQVSGGGGGLVGDEAGVDPSG